MILLPIKDSQNNNIAIGDVLAYPCRSGGSCWLGIGTLISVREEVSSYGRKAPVGTLLTKAGRKVRFERFERALIVTKVMTA